MLQQGLAKSANGCLHSSSYVPLSHRILNAVVYRITLCCKSKETAGHVPERARPTKYISKCGHMSEDVSCLLITAQGRFSVMKHI